MKKKKAYSCRPFYCGLIILACIFSVFYAKYVYYSDTPLHTLVSQTILFQDEECDLTIFPKQAYAYPLFHLTQKLIHLLLQIDYYTAAALLLPATIICSVFMYRKLIIFITDETDSNKYFADIVSLGAVLFNVARCWLNDWRYYSLQCGPNPFHNPTILFVRPFAIASFIYFIKWIQVYGVKNNIKYVLLFGIYMFLSVSAKPSYAIVFLPAMGIYTMYYMIRNKNIKFGIIAFIAVLPSLILLVIQQMWCTSQTDMLTVTISFGGFSHLSVIEVIMASLVTFPVVVLLFRIRWIKSDPTYFIAILALIIGWLQMYLLVNGMSSDFSWGYDLAVQFATIISLAKTRKDRNSEKHRKIVNIVAYAVFAYQVWVGIHYLQTIYIGTLFWI